MTIAAAESAAPGRQEAPWLKNTQFDSFFIFGLPLLALTSVIAIAIEPRLFAPILLIDLWVLGYHHVIATYTRLCFDRASFEENKFFVTWLIPIVTIPTLLIAWQIGLVAIVTIYFYWQWWHYTRQSWGVSRVLRGRDKNGSYEDGWLDQAIFYAVPVFGMLSRSAEKPTEFIGLEFYALPVPPIAATASGWLAFTLLSIWAYRRVQAWQAGQLAAGHTCYMLTHFGVFAAAYYFVPNITLGWLLINIWHNAQYILFVWMYNTKRFKGGIDPSAKFLSRISQPGRLWNYLGWCLAITGIVYWGVIKTVDWLFFAGLSATVVLYQIVNFHHYVVDSYIWKVRKKSIGGTLGVQQQG